MTHVWTNQNQREFEEFLILFKKKKRGKMPQETLNDREQTES